MELRLDENNILITGSTRGIGLGIANSVKAVGGTPLIVGRTVTDVEKVASSLSTVGVAADITSASGRKIVWDQLRNQKICLQGLVCNVGNSSFASGLGNLESEYRRAFVDNYLQAVCMVEESLEFLDVGSSIVMISSICGLERIGCPIPYSDMKAALLSFVRNSAAVLGQKSIRINAVSPGNVIFDGSVWDKKLLKNRAVVEEMLGTQVALNCLGRPDDVASMVVFLLSSLANFSTGANYVVDGGQVRR